MGVIASVDLPEGPWQGLFRHALTLIDEIRKHGTSVPDIRPRHRPHAFDYCANLAGEFLRQLPGASPAHKSRRR
uniref:hypothetical protein n=1 Tax=Burkholderia anthina TaxID=179879 RepID=UPI001ABB03CE|nr:hypothetical protein [Burkholderia anthina]